MAIGCIVLLLTAGMANAVSVQGSTKHFDITYGSSWPVSGGEDVGQVLEKSYSDVNNILGTCPAHIKVIVVGKKSMDEVGDHVEAFSAWNNKSSAIVLRQETVKNPKSLDVVAKHEICHLGLNPILANKDSKQFAWMEEGFCMVVSKEPFSDEKVSKYIVDKGFMSPSQIASAVDDDNYNVSKNGYMQSYSLIKYMAQRYGTDALVRMFKCPDTSFVQAFKKCTGEDFYIFYGEWEAYVRAKAASPTATAASPSRSQKVHRPTYSYMIKLEDTA